MTKKETLAKYKALFEPYMNKPVCVTFGRHRFTLTIVDITIARQTDLQNLPDKREKDGKQYTPQVLQVKTDTGETLDFVLEDIRKAVTLAQGLVIEIGDTRVLIYEGSNAN